MQLGEISEMEGCLKTHRAELNRRNRLIGPGNRPGDGVESLLGARPGDVRHRHRNLPILHLPVENAPLSMLSIMIMAI